MASARILRYPRPILGVAALGLAMLLQPAVGHAETDIGITASVVNRVTGTLENKTRVLALGDTVYLDEQITAGDDSRTQLIFLDETTLTLGPGSVTRLDRFVFDPARNTGDVVIHTTKGLFRFVTGNLNSNSYKIQTPTATIGIRGTVLDIAVDGSGAVTVGVLEGGATLRSLRGVAVDIRPGQMSSVRDRRSAPTPPIAQTPAFRSRMSPVDGGSGQSPRKASLRPARKVGSNGPKQESKTVKATAEADGTRIARRTTIRERPVRAVRAELKPEPIRVVGPQPVPVAIAKDVVKSPSLSVQDTISTLKSTGK